MYAFLSFFQNTFQRTFTFFKVSKDITRLELVTVICFQGTIYCFGTWLILSTTTFMKCSIFSSAAFGWYKILWFMMLIMILASQRLPYKGGLFRYLLSKRVVLQSTFFYVFLYLLVFVCLFSFLPHFKLLTMQW